MKKVIYIAVEYAALIHDRIMTLNDGQASMLSDKQLHFLVIGLLGMLLFLLIHPLFKALIRRGHEIIVSWFYVFTVILVITFAIEIGQRISNTGTMEFFDIVYGVAGFFWMFAIYALLRAVVLMFRRLLRRKNKPVSGV